MFAACGALAACAVVAGVVLAPRAPAAVTDAAAADTGVCFERDSGGRFVRMAALERSIAWTARRAAALTLRGDVRHADVDVAWGVLAADGRLVQGTVSTEVAGSRLEFEVLVNPVTCDAWPVTIGGLRPAAWMRHAEEAERDAGMRSANVCLDHAGRHIGYRRA